MQNRIFNKKFTVYKTLTKRKNYLNVKISINIR